jgi:hypothetical protein
MTKVTTEKFAYLVIFLYLWDHQGLVPVPYNSSAQPKICEICEICGRKNSCRAQLKISKISEIRG